MAQHGTILLPADVYAMSAKHNDTLVRSNDLKTPLTPPQEPTERSEPIPASDLNELPEHDRRASSTRQQNGITRHDKLTVEQNGQCEGQYSQAREKGSIADKKIERSNSPSVETTFEISALNGNSIPEQSRPATSNQEKRSMSDAREEGTGSTQLHDKLIQEGKKAKRLSAEKLKQLTTSPDSLPLRILSPTISEEAVESDINPWSPLSAPQTAVDSRISLAPSFQSHLRSRKTSLPGRGEDKIPRNLTVETQHHVDFLDLDVSGSRPNFPRAQSTPDSAKNPIANGPQELHRRRPSIRTPYGPVKANPPPSPMPVSIPLPPLSLPTYLQLELSSHRPSQLYIHRSNNSDFPYESSRVKIERLLNFLFLPHQLEGVLWFGTLACLDSWLYTFTILPLRLLKSLYILGQSWLVNIANEVQFVSSFVYAGSQRMWQRRRTRGDSLAGTLSRTTSETQLPPEKMARLKPKSKKHHKRTKSMPSGLLPDDKADILKGLLIIFTSLLLLKLDASRMYHWVRGQAAIKLYVIYNLLEVCDRLLSALGQDVLECLFSQEALERKPDGHSKILRPFWLFILALVYSVIHSTALFYQVITLNVAVNSYSNALITLLMSVQFVEIKSTVFKKFEKENLFQLTCADIVERFQLWHMMLIIASRNIVETGGFSLGVAGLAAPSATATSQANTNSTHTAPPRTASSILPRSFTIVPWMLSSITSYVPTIGHILGPFVIVLGSEMLIDWLKHAYINKFNNTKPVIYGRFLDVLAKDYYTNAFGNQNLTKRLGLPVIPLSCLMIRAAFQTHQMFVASWMPSPSMSSSTSLASIHEQSSVPRSLPTTTTGMLVRKMDEIFNQLPMAIVNSTFASQFTTILVLLLIFLILLVCKLCLGIGLLAFSRARYRAMKERQQTPSHHIEGGRRVGGWGVVEVDDDKRRQIYEDDPAGLQVVRDREARDKLKKEMEKDKGFEIDRVKRYEMVAKRIW